jgi:hypothetical protein
VTRPARQELDLAGAIADPEWAGALERVEALMPKLLDVLSVVAYVYLGDERHLLASRGCEERVFGTCPGVSVFGRRGVRGLLDEDGEQVPEG